MSIVIEQNKSIYNVINDTQESYRSHETITTLFAKVSSKYRDNIAISYGDVDMTYAELYDKSSQVADSLTKVGCCKGDFIGIYMERSPETVIAILGILRAGGVYVPIDPEHPIERNRYILENSKCQQIMTKERHIDKALHLLLSSNVKTPILMENCFSQGNTLFEDVSISPDELAYVIYTSGSTGKPKGTLIAHRGVVNLWNTFTKSLEITSHDVVTQFSTFSFDASILDTFLGLLNGSELVILTKEQQLTPNLFLDVLEDKRVTHIGCIPTSVFNRLAETTTSETKSKWKSVKNMIIAGEALLSDHVRKFQDKFGTDITIINGYGPTECTVITTIYKVKEYWDKSSVTVPIGYPIGNYKVYIVKEDGSLAEIGEEGELYIETFALSKGYIDLPEKTAEVFIKNPFSDDPKSKVYKSGDIVKVLQDGSLEFQYRKDGQLKLRGFRIEIGEIGNALSKHPNILDSEVIAIKEAGVTKHLSCFYSEKEKVTGKELKEHLKDYVPHYMIPSYFYPIEEIPLAPTGKVDRKKLESMDNPKKAQTEIPFEAPVGMVEQTIASIWEEVLDVSDIGRNADFFDIGGDSLSVMDVLCDLKLDYLNLRMNDLYEHKTVKELAEYIYTLDNHLADTEVQFTEYQDLKEYPELSKVQISDKDGLGSDILLTGATGYLGSHLLYQLLTTTDANIYTLVRSKVGSNGISRIWATLDMYFGQQFFTKYTNRIFVIEGDLVGRNLGISAEDREILASRLTSIIHAGADVRHFGNTESFQVTNVVGTKNLLELVYDNPRIKFHFISTIGIPEDMASADLWEAALKNTDVFYSTKLESVYTNSKLQAEKLVVDAIQQGRHCSIYRAGNLSCHSGTGNFQKNIDENFFYRMLKSFILLGKAPLVHTHVDITPIDFASTFMIGLMQRQTVGEIYHICNPVQYAYSEFINAITSLGYNIELLPQREYEHWVLREGVKSNPEGVQLAMALLDGDGVYNSQYKYSCEQSVDKLSNVVNIPCLVELLEKLIAHGVERGFFPKTNK